MLKKKAFRRLFITTVSIFVVLVIYTLTNLDSDVVIYDDATYINKEDMEVIYTLNIDNYVSRTTVYVDDDLSVVDKVKSLLEIMIEKNNKNALLPSNFKPILPKNTKIIDVTLNNDIIRVNFSSELLNITKEQSEKMIEAITYTITEFDDVLGIEIYVEGKLLEYIPNTNKRIPSILNRDFGINKVYSINSNENINKVFLCYLTKNNEDYYYVPVTKYVNDERQKIEIIVEELANSYIYEKNLISFLTNNTKMISYEINDNIMSIEMNDTIKRENEKGIDALFLSIFNNYDIEKIEILINNEKFLEKTRKNLEK